MWSLSDAPQRPWRFKGLERVTITFMFFRDFALWIWLEKNDRNTRQGWISLGPSWLPVEIQPPSFRVRWLCHSQATFEERVEERVFGQRAVWSKGHGNHTGQEETRVITCFFALSFSGNFYSWEQLHGDDKRHWWCAWHLMLQVITSLCTCPWVQSRFTLVIAPGSSFLGRFIWLLPANSQLT